MRKTIYFVFFSLLPGLSYQFVQDQLRPNGVGQQEWLGYALGVAPNFLGGLSLTAALTVILLELRGKFRPGLCALAALVALWIWEALQALGSMTFDPHDLGSTVPGVLIAWMGAQLLLRDVRKKSA